MPITRYATACTSDIAEEKHRLFESAMSGAPPAGPQQGAFEALAKHCLADTVEETRCDEICLVSDTSPIWNALAAGVFARQDTESDRFFRHYMDGISFDQPYPHIVVRQLT